MNKVFFSRKEWIFSIRWTISMLKLLFQKLLTVTRQDHKCDGEEISTLELGSDLKIKLNDISNKRVWCTWDFCVSHKNLSREWCETMSEEWYFVRPWIIKYQYYNYKHTNEKSYVSIDLREKNLLRESRYLRRNIC